jgi:hypothetical protein
VLRLDDLDRVVDPRPVAVARITIGVCAWVNLLQAWVVLSRAAGPRLALPLWDPLPAVTQGRATGVVLLGLVAATLVVIGVGTRAAALLLAAVVLGLFAWEQQTYSSHLMLTGWLALWLSRSRSDAAWSWRALHGDRSEVRVHHQLPLMTQLSVCYLFAAVAKLNPGFLSGDELRRMAALPGPDELYPVAAVATVAVEVSLAFLLWVPRVRLLAMAAGLALHVSIPLTMAGNRISLVVFSASCLSLYPLFLGADAREPSARQAEGSHVEQESG